VPKRSLPQDLTRVSADYAGASQFGGRVDLSRRFGDDGAWGVRVNGLHRQGDTPLDNLHSRTDIGALSLDYQGEKLRASLDLLIQNEKIDAPTRPFLVAAGLRVPDAPDGRRNATQPWSWWKSEGESALLRVEYDISDRLTVFADAGGSSTTINRLSDQTPTLVNAAGDTRVTPNHFKFQVDRSTYNAGLRAKLETGPVRHAITFMGTLYSDRNAQASVNGTPLSSNIYHPVTRPRQDIAAPASVPKVSSSDLSGFALADTLSVLDERVQLTLGARQQRVESRNFNAVTGARTLSYDESAITPLAGLVLKPWRNVSFYANYIEGLSKGDTYTNGSGASVTLAPYVSRQKEVGLKLDAGRFGLGAALFSTSKPRVLKFGQPQPQGEDRHRGAEINVYGEALRGLRVLGGVTWLDTKQHDTGDAATEGKRTLGIPKLQANLGLEWDVADVEGLAIDARVLRTGGVYADSANTLAVPAWTRLDAGVRYLFEVGHTLLTARLRVDNLTNRKYWASAGGYPDQGYLVIGAPRSVNVSLSADF